MKDLTNLTISTVSINGKPVTEASASQAEYPKAVASLYYTNCPIYHLIDLLTLTAIWPKYLDAVKL